jgi:hypothetical protein
MESNGDDPNGGQAA